MSLNQMLTILAALSLAGLVMTAFVALYAWKAPWWRHRHTPANPKGQPNIMGRALMALGVTWAAELDTTILVYVVGPGQWAFWTTIVIHLSVAASGANLLRLLIWPRGIPRKSEEGITP